MGSQNPKLFFGQGRANTSTLLGLCQAAETAPYRGDPIWVLLPKLVAVVQLALALPLHITRTPHQILLHPPFKA